MAASGTPTGLDPPSSHGRGLERRACCICQSVIVSAAVVLELESALKDDSDDDSQTRSGEAAGTPLSVPGACTEVADGGGACDVTGTAREHGREKAET